MVVATFACPDLTTFARLNELGLTVVGQRLEPTRAVLACRVVEPDSWCRRCGCSTRSATIVESFRDPHGLPLFVTDSGCHTLVRG